MHQSDEAPTHTKSTSSRYDVACCLFCPIYKNVQRDDTQTNTIWIGKSDIFCFSVHCCAENECEETSAERIETNEAILRRFRHHICITSEQRRTKRETREQMTEWKKSECGFGIITFFGFDEDLWFSYNSSR